MEGKSFRAWQKSKHGHANLANAFLKYPSVDVDAILRQRGEYIKSPEYEEERVKHAPRPLRVQAACSPPADEGAPDANERPLLERLQELRGLRRRAGKGWVDEVTLRWFTSGELDQELARLTTQHWRSRYYDQHGNAIDLRPHAFEDFIASKTARSESR